VTEEQVTQVLGLQWSIPVFPLGQSRRFLECARLVPLPLLKVAEMLPVHHIAASQHLYVAFVDRINYSALYAVEKVLDCHTEPCLAIQSQVLDALDELQGKHPSTEILLDDISEADEIASSILTSSLRLEATNVRMSGFDGYIWSRIIYSQNHADLVFRTR
jgi:hypothetical protein